MIYTASIYAAALRFTKRGVQLAIGDTPATETRIVRGQAAKAWSYEALPTLLREKLETAAVAQNFPSVHALLDYWSRMEATTTTTTTTPFEIVPASIITDLHANLADAVVRDATNLSPEEKECVWDRACNYITALNPQRRELAALKRAAVDWLQANLPALAASVRTLERKLADPTKHRDNRMKRSGNYRAPLCPACWEKVLREAVKFEGSQSTAWRQLKTKKELCPECQDKHVLNLRRNKSYVPHSIRNQITPIVNKVLQFKKSDSAGRMGGPHIEQDWSGVQPGDWFVADDVTWNVQVWTTDAYGNPYLCRPECLYLCDARTGYPTHFILIAGKPGQKASYTADDIRRLVLEAHDKLGLPHIGYLFENGPWRSRAVHDTQAGDKWMSWAEMESGLKTLKNFVEIRHTKPRTPRSKPVEGDFRILQTSMLDLPGNVGGNERLDKSDRVKKQEAEVKAGKVHPREYFLSFEQFGEVVAKKFYGFADEIQNGKWLPGISPREGWGTPVARKLPDNGRWLFATRRELLRVTAKGLRVKGHYYANGNLRVGDWMWAFYNLECPDVLTVSDKKQENFFTAARNSAPAMNARGTAEGRAALKQAQQNIDDFNRPAKIISGSIKHPTVANVVRDYDVNEQHAEVVDVIAEGVAAHRTAKAEATNARNRHARELEQLRTKARMKMSDDDSTIIAPLP